MMETKAGDAGAFKGFDLSRVPTPCFVVDRAKVEENLRILRRVADASGAKVLGALKAFSFPAVADLYREYLHGTCASGVHEARLAHEEFGGEAASFSAGYKDSDMSEIIRLSDHIYFNSPAQKDRFLGQIHASGKAIEVGLRINPEYSTGEVAKYDPAAPCSRLGTPISSLQDADMVGVDGIHMHTLCEQEFAPLEATWNAVLPKLRPYLKSLKFINFGGGHHITRADYDRDALIVFLRNIREEFEVDVYLEPGEACALDAGILIGEVIDLPINSINLAITDISATCHMPDVIEAPYRPAMLGEVEKGYSYRFGGPSCLAGDVIGDYVFENKLQIGDRFAFLDQAHYSMVKTNTFNGVPLPSIALWDSRTDRLDLLKQFDYNDFRVRLG